jgi:2-iminobutanoate/2-iminopropanoate deaminase
VKKIIFSEKAPKAIGPYSQAVLSGNTLYTSGQIALHPETGELVQGSVEIETNQVMANLAAVLAAADMNFSNVVKTTIFLKNMDDFATVNAIYGQFFEVNPPARETVEVARLPKSVNVEISCIAVK